MKKSESIGKLATALAAFQAEVKDPKRDSDNPYFRSKYVPLDGLLDAVRPALAKNGLSFLQVPSVVDRAVTITTVLMHISGEWIEADPYTLTAKDVGPQAIGSATTYGRRYSLSSILGVAWDSDDDGNQGTFGSLDEKNKSLNEKVASKAKAVKKDHPPVPDNIGMGERINNQMVVGLLKLARGAGMKVGEVAEKFGVPSINDMTVEQYEEAIKFLKEKTA